ncbi:SDR family oxidoreductase [Streptomyces sp. NPDC087263]|uniref:SDR family oxidoreductase n=1 Tax=Streptomyces sp. NPDC087263 TaxID=3365773 RepID=UPI00382E3345
MSGLPAAMGISTGRLSEPHEVASLVAFLASSHAANINGCDHIVDGGLVKTVRRRRGQEQRCAGGLLSHRHDRSPPT